MLGTLFLHPHTSLYKGQGSSVGIVTQLRPGRSGDRIPFGAIFFVPVRTLPANHPATFTVGTVYRRGVNNHSHCRSVPLLPCGFSWNILGLNLLPLCPFVVGYVINNKVMRSLTLRRLMSYIYMEHPFLMFLDHTQRRSTVGRTPLDE